MSLFNHGESCSEHRNIAIFAKQKHSPMLAFSDFESFAFSSEIADKFVFLAHIVYFLYSIWKDSVSYIVYNFNVLNIVTILSTVHTGQRKILR